MNTENNILIAEFMGYEIKNPQGKLLNLKINVWYPDNFKFDTDWNWLMEVVEKIESVDNNEFTVKIFNSSCEITGFETYPNFFIFANIMESKITAVYNCCVEFVKWHNQQKC